MARSKKSMTQQAVGLAATMMPAPVAKVVGTRWGSRLFILLLPFLLATGILTISWNNGIPSVSFDRTRALAVGQQAAKRVEQETMRVAQGAREPEALAASPGGWGAPQPMTVPAQPAAWPAQPAQPAAWSATPASQGGTWQSSPQQSHQPPPPVPQWGPPSYR